MNYAHVPSTIMQRLRTVTSQGHITTLSLNNAMWKFSQNTTVCFHAKWKCKMREKWSKKFSMNFGKFQEKIKKLQLITQNSRKRATGMKCNDIFIVGLR